jgi:hypothetical protein
MTIKQWFTYLKMKWKFSKLDKRAKIVLKGLKLSPEDYKKRMESSVPTSTTLKKP